MKRTYLAAALAAVVLANGCDSGSAGPTGPEPDQGPDLSRSGSIQGTHTLPQIRIPAGVTITATGPLTLNTQGAVEIAGTLTGDCVAITINGNSSLAISGRVRNACGTPPQDAPAPALTLIGNGDLTLNGAVIETSGDLEIKNDPALTESSFASPVPAGPADGPASAGGTVAVIGVSGSRFVAQPEKARNGTDGQNGTNGRDGTNWRLLARGDLVLSGGNLIQGQAGGDGGNGDHTGAPASSRGGDGGNGGRISVLATGRLTISGSSNRIVSGSGGKGGNGTATAAQGTGARAPGATGRGGNGGDPGLVRLEGQQGLSADASLDVVIGDGGGGGNGVANAADGQAICVDGHGQHGGHADAQGGTGGSSPSRKLVELGNAIVSGSPRVSGGNGGTGGAAVSRSGIGAAGQNCENCKNGGDGGNFAARGGDGGSARIRDIAGALVGNGGNGGASEHRGGNGGIGFNCCLPSPSQGGDGGKGGDASGGDGVAGTGRQAGVSNGVTIGSGNGARGGDGIDPGKGGDGGKDNTVARGPKAPGTGNFLPGPDGARCPDPPPSGTAIDGNYTLSGSRVSQSGACTFSPGITNPDVRIEFDGTNVIVNSTVRVPGPYDAQTGRWQASATTQPDQAGRRLRESFDGTWKRDTTGRVIFEGTLTFELLDSSGGMICQAVYQIVFRRK